MELILYLKMLNNDYQTMNTWKDSLKISIKYSTYVK